MLEYSFRILFSAFLCFRETYDFVIERGKARSARKVC